MQTAGRPWSMASSASSATSPIDQCHFGMPSRSSNREVGVNLAAHALYAAITGFVTEELSRQGDDPRRQIPQLRHLARVG